MRTAQRLTPVLLALAAGVVHAQVLYENQQYIPAGLAPSSWWEPDDSDWDNTSWDDFTLAAGGTITEVRWRGGYENGPNSERVTGFVVGFWPSINAGTQPDVTATPVEYSVRGLSGETLAGVFDGVTMYDYTLTIDPPFVAEPGVKYWVQIEGSKIWFPDWGVAWAYGGNQSHFRWVRGLHRYFNYPHDLMFTLIGSTPCDADFNGDGSVNTLDVLAFLNAWGSGDPRGDFNGDGSVNTLDVLAFLNAWSAGC